MLSQQPSAIPVLPLKDLTDKQDTKSIRNLILYEPDASEVFDAIVPEYLAGLIYGAVCESVASELAARRTAMEAATNNAEEMIEKLNLLSNLCCELCAFMINFDGIEKCRHSSCPNRISSTGPITCTTSPMCFSLI